MSMTIATLDTLPSLDGYPFQVHFSEGRQAQAARLADLAKDAYEYFSRLYSGTAPELTALFLAPDDWKVHVSRHGYGGPRYQPVGFVFDSEMGTAPENRLTVATDDNAFWQSFGKTARVTSPLSAWPKLKRTYAGPEGQLEMRRFFDLIVVHELAHAFEEQGGAVFPAAWLSEIFANLSLHGFVSTIRPSELEHLTVFPEAMTHIAAFNLMVRLRGYRSLDDFELHIPLELEEQMSGANYGWYQLRFLRLVRSVFADSGEAALTRLWALGRSEAARRPSGLEYFREHGTAIGWPGRMSARELSALLASEVSPLLGQAIADWP
jgi:hypothetical protein